MATMQRGWRASVCEGLSPDNHRGRRPSAAKVGMIDEGEWGIMDQIPEVVLIRLDLSGSGAIEHFAESLGDARSSIWFGRECHALPPRLNTNVPLLADFWFGQGAWASRPCSLKENGRDARSP